MFEEKKSYSSRCYSGSLVIIYDLHVHVYHQGEYKPKIMVRCFSLHSLISSTRRNTECIEGVSSKGGIKED